MKSIPKLRFKEFRDNWELNRLGDVSKITSGGTPSRTNEKYWDGDIPWISTSLIDFNLILKAEEYITKDGVDNSSAKVFSVGTILMAMYGQGKTRGKVAVLGIEATTNQACAAILADDRIDGNFLFQNLAGRYDEIRNLSNEGGQQNLSGGIIKDIKFSSPSLPEQQKIASFLSAVDEKIQQLTRKIKLLEQYKKGVMQQLFSGKLRFKDENGKPYPKWEEKRLDDLCDVRDGTHDSPKYYSTGKPLLTSKNLSENGTINFDDVNYISDADFENINKRSGVSIGDILFGMIGTIGNPAIVKSTGFAIKNVALIKIGPKLLNSFLLQYFMSDLTLRQFHILNTGNTQKFVSLSTIRGLKVLLPLMEEQQKIANFLSALDTKIESVTNKITQTQTFKKGLLQQMFV